MFCNKKPCWKTQRAIKQIIKTLEENLTKEQISEIKNKYFFQNACNSINSLSSQSFSTYLKKTKHNSLEEELMYMYRNSYPIFSNTDINDQIIEMLQKTPTTTRICAYLFNNLFQSNNKNKNQQKCPCKKYLLIFCTTITTVAPIIIATFAVLNYFK